MSNRNTIRNNNFHYSLTTLFASSLTILTLLSLSILSSPKASADSSADVNVSVTVPATCSLTANPDTLSTTITPGNTGTIGTSTIKAICNDPAGLAVYAVGYTNDTYGNNNLASTVGGTTINIPTAIASSPSTSQWNMTINAVSGDFAPTIPQDFENTAHIIPTQYTKVAYRNTMTDMGTNATGAQFNATFTAYIGPTQAAGTYNGKVKFLLVHPNVIDSSTNPATEAPSALPTMQTVSTWGSSVTAGQEVTSVDARDGKLYTVARLADGHLWMTQNLDLDLDSTRTYTSADTDLPANATWTPSTSTYASNNISAWEWSHTAPRSYDPGELYWGGDIDYTYMNQTLNAAGDTHYHAGNYYNWTAAVAMNDSTSQTVDETTVDQSICPAGWTLPRPGYGDGTLYGILSGYDANTNAVIGEGTHYVASGYNASDAPIYFTYVGNVISNSGISGANSTSYYWTNGVGGSSEAYDLRSYGYHSDVFNYSSGTTKNGRGFGKSIRCIARPVSSTVVFAPE
ncbi:hypothetical protein IKG06_00705 [Candidatus Saccharibacteria bacterium]|nr:hypothetical protein [Candidatus Saccharibacteria bacterium]